MAAPLRRRAPPGFQGRRRYISIQRAKWGTNPLRALVVWKPPLMLSEMLSDAWMFSTLIDAPPRAAPSLFRVLYLRGLIVLCSCTFNPFTYYFETNFVEGERWR